MNLEARRPVTWNRAGERLRATEELRDIFAHRDLLFALVHRDLTVRYKRSPLGFIWTMLHPLLLMTIFVMVFSTLFRFAIPNYAVYFLAPFIAWNFFNQAVIESMNSVAWNGALMKRVRVPKSIFVLASTISGLINLTLALLPLLAIMLVLGMIPKVSILFLPVSFLIVGVFTLGTALTFTALAVYFVDVREMYQAANPALMYLTPIIYPLTIVPERFRWFIKLNPLVYQVQLFRGPIYWGEVPTAMTILVAAGCAVVALVIGWSVFRRLAPGFHIHL